MRAVLQELGKWPVVEQNWSDEGWNLEDTLALLRGKYNAPILLEAWVAIDDKNSSVHILQVTVNSRVKAPTH